MVKSLLSVLLVCVVGAAAFGQATGDFQTHAATGNWNNTSAWERWNGAAWINPAPNTPTSADGVITIQAGHQVTIPNLFSVTVDQLVVSASNSTILVISSGGTLDLIGSGADLTFNAGLQRGRVQVSGTLVVNQNATIVNSASNKLFILNGGVYQHNYANTAGTVYLANWASGSTLSVTGLTSASGTMGGLQSQVFHHLTWNCPSQGNNIDMNLNGSTTSVNGDLTINDTGGNYLIFSVNNTFSLTVGGNFLVANAANFSLSEFNPTTATVNITGNFTDTSSGYSYFGFGGNANVTIGGSFNMNFSGISAGLDLAGDVGNTVINVAGNFSGTSGTLFKSGAGSGTFNFNGSAAQTFSFAATPITDAVNFTVVNPAIVDLGTSALTGTGNFTLNSGATIRVGSASGLVQGSGSGNIRVTGTRTYTAAGNIVYNGTVAQSLGSEWGSGGALNGVSVNLNINNSNVSGVTNNIIGNTSVVGVLTLTQGPLNIGNSNTLDVKGIFNSSGGTIGGDATSNLTFSGSGAVGTLSFALGTEFLNNLTISRSSTVTLGTNLTIGGALNLSGGDLNFTGRTLTMNGGSITSSSTGLISTSATNSNLIFGGSTFTGPVPFNGGFSNVINSLTFNTNGGTFSWNSGVTINSSLTLSAGAVTHTSGITMGTGSTFFKGGGSISGSALGATSSYNVTYSGTGSTGVELPTSSTALANLAVSSSGTVNLATNNITINGTFSVTSGTFSAGSNNLTMKGSTWTIGSSGAFSGGTATVTFGSSTTIGGTGPKSFNNVVTSSGSTLVLPAATVSVTGNFNLNATSTFTSTGSTLSFTGASATQTLTGTGKNFNNITVNKSSGVLQMLPSVNLIGILDIQSATNVQSNGNLTLISTSDGTSGNASITKIASGGSVTGSVLVQRRMSSEGQIYRDISSPVQTATVSQIQSSGIPVTGITGTSYPCGGLCGNDGASMYTYTESVTGAITNGYTAMTSSAQTLTPGKGYNVLVRSGVGAATMTLTGTINSGDVVYNSLVSFTNTPNAGDGWNFIGNPYPASIDWDNGWTVKTNVQGNMISIWDAGANAYKTWNGSVGSLGDGSIATSQGFWFQASATPALTVTEDSKLSTTGAFYRKKTEAPHYLEIIVKGPSVEDRTYVQKIKGSTLGFDGNDGTKLIARDGFGLATLASGTAGRELAINGVDEVIESGDIQMSMMNAIEGEYSFSKVAFGDFGNSMVSVRDNYMYTTVSLDNGADYKFTVTDNAESKRSDRFVLVFGENGNKAVTSILYPNPVVHKLSVTTISTSQPTGTVLDNTGHALGLVKWDDNTAGGTKWTGTYDMDLQSSGMYFVRVQSNNNTDVIKFLKK